MAEDNAVNQKVAAAMLKRLGYRVDVVANGREAVVALESVPYVAVLMDCQMPVMNGYEASTEIRGRERAGRRVPIVALTASAIKGDDDRWLSAGMDAYVTKPVTVAALGDVLARLIGPAAQPGGSEILDQETVANLWDLGNGSASVVQELADSFLRCVPADLAVLQAAAGRADLAAVARGAHRLRGSCAAVGARTMSELASQIESAALEPSPGDLAAPAAEMGRTFDDVRAALLAATSAVTSAP